MRLSCDNNCGVSNLQRSTDELCETIKKILIIRIKPNFVAVDNFPILLERRQSTLGSETQKRLRRPKLR